MSMLSPVVGGAAVGGALGWFYDKLRQKKEQKSRAGIRIALGALLGSAAGLYGPPGIDYLRRGGGKGTLFPLPLETTLDIKPDTTLN